MTPDEVEKCLAVLKKLLDQKHQLNNQYFLGPVQPLLSEPEFAGYLRTISPSVPMDLIAVQNKLLQPGGLGGFGSSSEFANDVRMTFTNAIAYNKDAKVN